MGIPEIIDLILKVKFSEALNKIDKLDDEDKLEGKICKALIWLFSGQRPREHGIEFLESVQKECRDKVVESLVTL